MKRIHVHPEAKAEAEGTFDWYWDRTPSAALEFDNNLRAVYARVRKNPRVCPSYIHGTRRAFVDRFPLFVVFRELPAKIQIVAVAHAKRRPGYWTKRLKQ
jgi:toxin ParE1/3/4